MSEATRLRLERGPGQLPERPGTEGRDSVNPGDGVREDGGDEKPELTQKSIS